MQNTFFVINDGPVMWLLQVQNINEMGRDWKLLLTEKVFAFLK